MMDPRILTNERLISLETALVAINEPEREWFRALLTDYRALAEKVAAYEAMLTSPVAEQVDWRAKWQAAETKLAAVEVELTDARLHWTCDHNNIDQLETDNQALQARCARLEQELLQWKHVATTQDATVVQLTKKLKAIEIDCPVCKGPCQGH